MMRIINRWHDEVVVMGDFNEVCFVSERHGSTLYASNVAEFNTFITNSHLIDVPLGGYSFTWSNTHASKMSKLDRFLVSNGLLDLFPNLSGLILHLRNSNHKPIILKEFHIVFGFWNKISPLIQKKSNKEHDHRVLEDFLLEIDPCLDKGEGFPDDLPNRAKILHDIGVIDHKISIDMAQKAKVKCVGIVCMM
ncbi:RNA-directed DNA polymerase, eukaryota [Tanacetum coccineum]